MKIKESEIQPLLRVLLPEELFEYFEILKLDVTDQAIHVYIDEINNTPEEYESEKLTSKGFHTSVTIQDFPIRERAVYLHVRRRRWQIESNGKVVSRDWDAVAKGTRYTKGFADFLKELFGQMPGKQ